MRNYKRKTSVKQCTPEMLETARQGLREGISKRRIAADLGISETALRKRLKLGSGSQKLGRFSPVFTSQQSEELANHCRALDKAFYGVTLNDLRRLAFQFAEANNIQHRFNRETKLAGRDWACSFMKKHRLSLRTPQQTSLARIMGFNKEQAKIFFRNLSELKQQHTFPPNRQYNMDETGLSTVPNCPPKVISTTGKRAVGKVSSSERGELTTAVCALSAAGNYVPPALIFKRKRQNPLLLNGAPPGTLMLVSDSGYMNGELFLEWLKHFQSEVKASVTNPVLLILDNHSSHLNLNAVIYCRDNGIILLSIPPYSSHKTQPLDRCFFKALKTHYSNACSIWMTNNPGRVITQYQIAELFGIAYCKCATVEKAVTAFKTCGIEPLNPEVFTDDDFLPSLVTDIPQVPNQPSTNSEHSNASTSALAAPCHTSEPRTFDAPTVYASFDPASSTSGSMLIIKRKDVTDPQVEALDLSKSAKVSPGEIRPLPKRNLPQQRRKKGLKSEIITSTPVKQRLETAFQEKQQPPKAKRKLASEKSEQSAKETAYKEKQQPPKAKRKLTSEKSEQSAKKSKKNK